MLNREKQKIQIPEKLKSNYKKVTDNYLSYNPTDDIQLTQMIDAVEEEGKELVKKISAIKF